MRAVLQRVSRAKVTVDGTVVGEIDSGWLALIGVVQGDSTEDALYLAEKTLHLRAFPDDDGKMNRSVLDTKGSILAVSQFTLYGDCRKGRRPSFSAAAKPDEANVLYNHYCQLLAQSGINVATGVFQAHMDIELVNDGPVTMILDSSRLF